MSSLNFTKTELAAAIARGVCQCVMIGSRAPLRDAFRRSPEPTLQVFAVDENPLANSPMTFVPTQFACETLAAALEKSDFNRLKASLFVWLGGAGYRTLEGVFASLAFIASLPKGSGVVFDYMVERTSSWELAQNDRGRPICANGELTHTALDGLASRILVAGGNFKYLIQPQAVAAMLRGLGFRQIVDLAEDETATIGGHLVSAVV